MHHCKPDGKRQTLIIEVTMKPRTKLEKEVTWLSSHLLPPSMDQIEDAQLRLFAPKAYYTKKYGYDCLECGGQFRVPQAYEEGVSVTCPHCGKVLSVGRTRKHRETILNFYMLMQTAWHDGKEFVVQRLFEVRKYLKRGKSSEFSWWNIAEYFTTDGKQVCLGIPLGMFGYWNYWADMTIKKPMTNASYYGGSHNSYYVKTGYNCIESVSPILERNGFRGDFEGYCPQFFVEELMCNPEAEKLYKLDSRLFRYSGNDILKQVKIVNRHNYHISDVSIWVDTIGLLRKLKMDDRSPKYICPVNLIDWHNELLERWKRVQAKEAAERRRMAEIRRREEELKRLEREKDICEEYVKRIARFLQLHIQDELINITPIPTVPAVHEEGNAMHHCVFSCGYYKNPQVLLLSARDKFGNRVETIEVNLQTYRVAQSRGVHNSNTEHHDRILALMEQGMEQIRELNTRRINIKAA